MITFEIGPLGLGVLGVIALIFGVASQFAGRPGSRWQWLVAALGWFGGGLFASEVVWGNLTVDDIQPIIDGLAFDEALLGGLIGGILAAVATRLVTGGSPFRRRVPA